MKASFANVAPVARLSATLAMMLALLLLATWPAGSGVGVVAGAVAAIPLLTHLLMFGVRASRRAAPPWVMQGLALAGLAAVVGASLLESRQASLMVMEGGLFATTLGGSCWALTVIAARAPTLGEQQAW